MKMGENFQLLNKDLFGEMAGKIVTVTMEDKSEVTARIVKVGTMTTDLKVVAEGTKE